MNKLKELFLMEEQMPCSPKEIVIRHYVLPSMLENSEQEEAAARLISFSQEFDKWVGVSWRYLAEKIEEDYKKTDEKPFSGIYIFGFEYVIKGIRELVESQMFFLTQQVDREKTFDVLFPTRKLVLQIMEKQG